MKKLKDAMQKAESALVCEVLSREREKRVALYLLPPETADTKPHKIVQAFIKEIRRDNKPFCDVRIRREGKGQYSLTAKFRPERQEASTRITKEMFETLWKKSFSKQEKDRYKLSSGWIVDHIKSDGGRIVAEYEFKDEEEEVKIPKSFKVKEVLQEE